MRIPHVVSVGIIMALVVPMTFWVDGTVRDGITAPDASAAKASSRPLPDFETSYNMLAAQSPDATVFTELGGTTLRPGVYNSEGGTFWIDGVLTLDGRGDPRSVFLFQTATTLKTARGSGVRLINGAQACHVYWQIGSVATLGEQSDFKGNIFAFTAATLAPGATVEGTVSAGETIVLSDPDSITPAPCDSGAPSTHNADGAAHFQFLSHR